MPDNSNNWWSCDGNGDAEGKGRVSPPPRPTRRQLLGGTLAAALTAWAGRSALADITVGKQEDRRPERDTLVVLFLRGGVDGLSMVVPHGDDNYYRARPAISIGAPRKNGVRADGRVINLDDFFGLHPVLAPLHPLYADGLLAIVHAVGSGDQTRSHFEAMAAMERGQPGGDAAYSSGVASGWLGRHLTALTPADPSPLRAVAFGSILPDSLRGATDVSVLNSLADFKLDVPGNREERFAHALSTLYQSGNDEVTAAGRATLSVLDTLKRIDPANYKPENGATYPDSDLGRGLRQVACLIKARVGLEVACLDRGGWDTHVAQGGATGFLALHLADVGASLAAFARDLGVSGLANVTCVVQTEFGRRVQENSGLGTDHGRGSAMMVLGGNIHGGKVYGKWPGLKPDQLEPPGDLRVTTDYRAVLSEIAHARLGADPAHINRVFPDTPAIGPALGIAG